MVNRKKNLARTGNAQITSIHQVYLWIYKGSPSQMIVLFKVWVNPLREWSMQFKKKNIIELKYISDDFISSIVPTPLMFRIITFLLKRRKRSCRTLKNIFVYIYNVHYREPSCDHFYGNNFSLIHMHFLFETLHCCKCLFILL